MKLYQLGGETPRFILLHPETNQGEEKKTPRVLLSADGYQQQLLNVPT